MRWNWLEFAGWCSLSSVFAAGTCYLLSLLPLSDASRRIYEVGEFLTLIGWVGTLVVVAIRNCGSQAWETLRAYMSNEEPRHQD